MRKLIVAAFAALALFASCKTNKNLANANTVATAPAAEETATFTTVEPAAPATSTYKPSTSTSTYKPSTSTSTYKPSSNVRTQSEDFAFDSTNDATVSSGNSYFIIVGSFSSLENANRFKGELAPKGFSAIVLHSNTGYYRVCVNSYASEQSARVRISQIRSEFPEYNDCWLLMKK